MWQIFQTKIAKQMLGTPDPPLSKILHRVFNDLNTLMCFIPAGAYPPLIFNTGDRKRKEGTIAEELLVPSPVEVFLFFRAIHFVNEFQSNKKLTVLENYKNGNKIVLLVQLYIKA